jgi:16S rRNA (cytidine1402-2'-O)-methyltransferase
MVASGAATSVTVGKGAAVAGQGSLVVVATPIGNLADLSPRAAQALREADLVACEDTRRTATLLRHAGSEAPMVAVHQHNEAARAADLVARMRAGARVALVSDAGMPLVSDPGARLVRAALEASLPVSVVPGPSAVTAALVASGLAGEGGFVFVGFVPRRAADRRRLMERLAGLDVPAVAFESPRRLPALLAEIAAAWPDRQVAVARELTKLHEEVLRGTAAQVAARVREPPRGEVAVVVGPAAAPAEPDDARLREVLALLRDAGLSPARAAEVAAALGAAPRNRAYRIALDEAGSSAGGAHRPH